MYDDCIITQFFFFNVAYSIKLLVFFIFWYCFYTNFYICNVSCLFVYNHCFFFFCFFIHKILLHGNLANSTFFWQQDSCLNGIVFTFQRKTNSNFKSQISHKQTISLSHFYNYLTKITECIFDYYFLNKNVWCYLCLYLWLCVNTKFTILAIRYWFWFTIQFIYHLLLDNLFF